MDDGNDPRTPSTARFDALVDQVTESTRQVADLSAAVRELVSSPRNTQTIIHKTEGMGAWGAAAVTACFATMIGLILISLEIHDLKAWSDIYRGQISKLLEVKK